MIQPLKWWGGKHYLAKKIIDLMPRHLHYVEPYAGGLAVLLEKDPFDRSLYWGEKGYEQGVSEVVNDIHRELTNFWRVCNEKIPSPLSSGKSRPCHSHRSNGRMPRPGSTRHGSGCRSRRGVLHPLSAEPGWWIQGFCHPFPEPHPAANERAGVGVVDLC